jgi:hypothetical protein
MHSKYTVYFCLDNETREHIGIYFDTVDEAVDYVAEKNARLEEQGLESEGWYSWAPYTKED